MPTILLADIIYRQIPTKPPPVMGVKQQVIHISTLFITLIRAYTRIKENLHGGDQHAKMHIPPPRPPITEGLRKLPPTVDVANEHSIISRPPRT